MDPLDGRDQVLATDWLHVDAHVVTGVLLATFRCQATSRERSAVVCPEAVPVLCSESHAGLVDERTKPLCGSSFPLSTAASATRSYTHCI